MGRFTTQKAIDSRPSQVLRTLTDPVAAARWAPVDFELRELRGDRLEAGSKARVAGRLAGRDVTFEIEVFEADDGRLALRASGPVVVDVEYEVEGVGEAAVLTARLADRIRRDVELAAA
jgi:hypothetical protein